MYYVYLLELKNGSIYTGSTPNLEMRIEEHVRGSAEATKNLRPIKLVWHCGFEDRIKALRFERYLKTGSGQAFRNRRLV